MGGGHSTGQWICLKLCNLDNRVLLICLLTEQHNISLFFFHVQQKSTEQHFGCISLGAKATFVPVGLACTQWFITCEQARHYFPTSDQIAFTRPAAAAGCILCSASFVVVILFLYWHLKKISTKIVKMEHFFFCKWTQWFWILYGLMNKPMHSSFGAYAK